MLGHAQKVRWSLLPVREALIATLPFYLKPEISFNKLDATARATSDNETTNCRNEASANLFRTINNAQPSATRARRSPLLLQAHFRIGPDCNRSKKRLQRTTQANNIL
jgi:hypothetical protein